MGAGDANAAGHKADWVYRLAGDARGIARTLAEGVETRVFVGDKVMLSVVRMAPNAVGSLHHHPNEQWGVLLEGSCTRLQGGAEVEVVAGEFWHTPGGVEHGIRAGANGAVVLDIFSPPREEYRSAGKGYGVAEKPAA